MSQRPKLRVGTLRTGRAKGASPGHSRIRRESPAFAPFHPGTLRWVPRMCRMETTDVGCCLHFLEPIAQSLDASPENSHDADQGTWLAVTGDTWGRHNIAAPRHGTYCHSRSAMCLFGHSIVSRNSRALPNNDEEARAQPLGSMGSDSLSFGHDFNNLLAYLLIYIDHARQRTQADAQASRYLDSAVSVALLGRDMLSEFAGGSQPLRSIQLGPTVGQIVELLSCAHLMSNTVRCQVDPKTPAVRITRIELTRIVSNLVKNAYEAVEADRGSIDVLVDFVSLSNSHARLCGADQGGNFVRIGVSDNGPGMSENTRQHAFDPWVTTKTSSCGTGLGLSIVKDIAKRRGGFVTLCSELGAGTNVTVFLPAAP